MHQAIENLSENEISILLKMINGLLNNHANEYEIEEVPEDDPELPRYIKILEEMRNGEYVEL